MTHSSSVKSYCWPSPLAEGTAPLCPQPGLLQAEGGSDSPSRSCLGAFTTSREAVPLSHSPAGIPALAVASPTQDNASPEKSSVDARFTGVGKCRRNDNLPTSASVAAKPIATWVRRAEGCAQQGTRFPRERLSDAIAGISVQGYLYRGCSDACLHLDSLLLKRLFRSAFQNQI